MPPKRASTPRSLRPSTKNSANHKSRVALERRKQLARGIRGIRSDMGVQRRRNQKHVAVLFQTAGVLPPIEMIKEKTLQKMKTNPNEKCTVVEIGQGHGYSLHGLATAAELLHYRKNIEFVGVDALPTGSSRLPNVRFRTGNILTKPFPKGDIFFSIWTVGSVGNIGFLVRKTANALKANGIAVLHINKFTAVPPEKNPAGEEYVTNIQNMEKLAKQLESAQLPNCFVRIQKNLGWGSRAQEDFIVVIQKK